MPVTPIDGAKYFGAKPATPKPNLDMKQFLRLLTVQLTNQNPLEPMNDRDFFAQMAQLGQVQGMDDLKKSAEVTQAAALMGKWVTAVRPLSEGDAGSPQLVTGEVTRLTFRNGERFIGLKMPDGGLVDVRMESIQHIER
jgi:flagellar basal-body rod modification protein FlgD